MKKYFIKATSLIMALLVLLSTAVLGASAKTAEAERSVDFSLVLLSETRDRLCVSLNLDSGSFSSAEIYADFSGLKCIEMKKGEMLSRFHEKGWAEAYTSLNAETGIAAFACTAMYNTPGEFIVMTFKKERQGYNLEITVSSCAVMQDKAIVEIPAEVANGKIENGINYTQLPDIDIIYRSSAKIDPNLKGAGTDGTYSFVSSNPAVASVDSRGNVFGRGAGKTLITVTYTDAEGHCLFGDCEVTVTMTLLQIIIYYLLFGWIWY